MKIQSYYIYILTNKSRKVLYVGVTNDLVRRFHEHKIKLNKGSFTERYNVDILIYFETYNHIDEAIKREKQIKGYSRLKKDALIENFNPDRVELYENGILKKINKQNSDN